MFVRPDDGSDLAAGDALVGDSDPHVVARQHDLGKLRGSHHILILVMGMVMVIVMVMHPLGTFQLAVVHLEVYWHRIFVFLEGILDHGAGCVRTILPPAHRCNALYL